MKNKLREFYQKYEKYFSPTALLLGFVWDSLTLKRIDLWLENLIILSYLFIVGVSILLFNAYESGKVRGRFFDKFVYITPFFLQFAFGGLFSAFTIFYSRSASLVASWPFLLILAALLIGNELFREKYLRLTFQLSVFFVAIHSYAVLAMPVVLGDIGALVFIASGLVSLGVMAVIIWLIYKIIPERFFKGRRILYLTIGLIYVSFNVLYFTNIMPPVPLSLKESGVYHNVQRASGGYMATYEPSAWYNPFEEYSSEFHWQPGEKVYCFTSVFAPTKIDTTIFHRWSYFDEAKSEWINTDEIKYFIIGGHEKGYRGYTFKQNVHPGDWQVEITNNRGQVLGKVNFEIVNENNEVELKTKIIK